MTDYRIIAVRHGLLHTRQSHFYLNYDVVGEPDEPIVVGYWFWLITGGGRRVLVDTGFTPEAAGRRGRQVVVPVLDAFAELGLTPDDEIDVVLTHAHYDHAGNLGWFRRARVWMSVAERRFWNSGDSRHAQFRSVVDDADLEAIERAAAEGRLVDVAERVELAPGIELIGLPGHTPGQLGVRVSTRSGPVLLASDAVHTQEELDRDLPFRHNTDLVGLYRGLEAMRAWLADGSVATIVPGHEAAALGQHPPLAGALSSSACVIG